MGINLEGLATEINGSLPIAGMKSKAIAKWYKLQESIPSLYDLVEELEKTKNPTIKANIIEILAGWLESPRIRPTIDDVRLMRVNFENSEYLLYAFVQSNNSDIPFDVLLKDMLGKLVADENIKSEIIKIWLDRFGYTLGLKNLVKLLFSEVEDTQERYDYYLNWIQSIIAKNPSISSEDWIKEYFPEIQVSDWNDFKNMSLSKKLEFAYKAILVETGMSKQITVSRMQVNDSPMLKQVIPNYYLPLIRGEEVDATVFKEANFAFNYIATIALLTNETYITNQQQIEHFITNLEGLVPNFSSFNLNLFFKKLFSQNLENPLNAILTAFPEDFELLSSERKAVWFEFLTKNDNPQINVKQLKYLRMINVIERELKKQPSFNPSNAIIEEEIIGICQIYYLGKNTDLKNTEERKFVLFFLEKNIAIDIVDIILEEIKIVKSHSEIPQIIIQGEELQSIDSKFKDYSLETLHKNDWQQLLIGDIVNCCQKIGGEGEACALESWRNPDCGTVVIRKNGVIVGESFIWKGVDKDGKKTLVFDSWERLGPHDDFLCLPFYAKMREILIEKHGFGKVTLGSGGGTKSLVSSLGLQLKEVEIVKYRKNNGEPVGLDAIRQYDVPSFEEVKNLYVKIKNNKKLASISSHITIAEIASIICQLGVVTPEEFRGINPRITRNSLPNPDAVKDPDLGKRKLGSKVVGSDKKR